MCGQWWCTGGWVGAIDSLRVDLCHLGACELSKKSCKVERLISELGYNDGKESHCNLKFSVLQMINPHQPYLSL